MASEKNFVYGVFDDDEVIKKAAQDVIDKGVKVYEVYSPFPLHGIDPILGYPLSRLPIAAFLFGLTGTILALTLQIYTLGVDWPMIIGGKPFLAFPDFIPITFEATVLISALGMVATFFIVSDLKPYGQKIMFDKRSTDDKFVIAVEVASNKKFTEEQLAETLKSSGAIEVDKRTTNV